MKTIKITTQKQFDALPKSFKEYTVIEIKDTKETIYVRQALGNASVEAWDNASVRAWGNASVEALGNASVEALGNASVRAWGNASVEAWGNASVEAWDNASVRAWDNASVRAWGNASVEALGNASVRALGNASVRAWDNACTWLSSDYATVILFCFAVCFKLAKGKITKKSKTATIITPKHSKGTDAWLGRHGIESKAKVVLYKKVSKDFQTQEDNHHKTDWKVGSVVEHKDWQPKDDECGEGKFHACARPYFCDEFRTVAGDKYIAIEIAKKDLYAWDDDPSYPYKIAFRKGKILYECDSFGKEIS